MRILIHLPINSIYLGLLLLLLGGCLHGAEEERALHTLSPSQLSQITFGSCNKEYKEQDIWSSIAANQSELFIWLGDMVYPKEDSASALKNSLSRQKSHPEYQNFIANHMVLGVWDDHDFYEDGGDVTKSEKEEKKLALLDFLDVSEDSLANASEGLYSHHSFQSEAGPVHLIILDARYDKLPWDQGQDRILGETQWKWLERTLKKHPNGIHIFASSIQLIPNRHRFDHWGRAPQERQRFLKLIEKYQIKNPIVISGDRHIAEISKLSIGESQILWELTSSGLTHSYSSFSGEENPYRQGKVFFKRNFGLIRFDKERVSLEIKDDKNHLVAKQLIPIQ